MSVELAVVLVAGVVFLLAMRDEARDIWKEWRR